MTKPSKLDEHVAQWCRDLNEKIPVAPLTAKEKELLQETLAKDCLTENDFATRAIRRELDPNAFHDYRRPLPL